MDDALFITYFCGKREFVLTTMCWKSHDRITFVACLGRTPLLLLLLPPPTEVLLLLLLAVLMLLLPPPLPPQL